MSSCLWGWGQGVLFLVHHWSHPCCYPPCKQRLTMVVWQCCQQCHLIIIAVLEPESWIKTLVSYKKARWKLPRAQMMIDIVWATIRPPQSHSWGEGGAGTSEAGTSISLLRWGRGVGWAMYIVVDKSKRLTWLESWYWHTCNTMEKGMVLPRYGNPEPVPIPKCTHDHIIMVLPIPVSCLSCEQLPAGWTAGVLMTRRHPNTNDGWQDDGGDNTGQWQHPWHQEGHNDGMERETGANDPR